MTPVKKDAQGAPPVPDPSAPPVGKGSGPNGCFRPDEVAAKKIELAASDDAQWKRGLRDHGLTLVELPVDRWDGQDANAPVGHREGTRAGKPVILLGTTFVGCNDTGGSPFQFACKGDMIYVVRGRYDSRWLTVPTCPPTTCAPPAFPGGCGAAMRPVGMSAELPPGTHFGGDEEIPILQYVVQEQMVGKNPCPDYLPPPPPP
jgi:hypothetical protein